MRGSYSSYISYDLDIVGLTAFGPLQPVPQMLVGDLDKDGDVDLADYAAYLSGLHADLSGLTSDAAYRKGDMNSDGVNDFNDFVLFRQAYDIAHGAGSFAALGAVPEPTIIALVLLGAIGSLVMQGRRRPVEKSKLNRPRFKSIVHL
jgi:hypothetical protein